MDFQTVIDLISNLGFPIVVVGCLMWFILYLMNSHKEEMQTMQDKIEKTTDALNANTTVIAELRTLIQQYIKQQAIVGVVGVYDLLLRCCLCIYSSNIPLHISDWLWVGWKVAIKTHWSDTGKSSIRLLIVCIVCIAQYAVRWCSGIVVRGHGTWRK